MVHKQMQDIDVFKWVVGTLTALLMWAAKAVHARLNAYEKAATERAIQMGVMIEKMDALSITVKEHMKHEEKEDAELKIELKEIRGEINDLKLNLARIPKRKGDE